MEEDINCRKEEEEEPLGSVTHVIENINSLTKSSPVTLRSSARVNKKKLDSLNKPPDKKDDEEAADEQPITKKPVMHWPQEAIDTFFEALNEHGKDFSAIQRYFVKKNQKTYGASVIKTKMQIRRFYYQAWAKISPNLKFPPHIKQIAQELYGLINYGEYRKKVKLKTQRDSFKLMELVVRGYTQIKLKGKTVQIRTPRCRALRRISRLDEWLEAETRLPSGEVRVELTPRDSAAWARVQATAQNPRIYLNAPLQTRLNTLFTFLQKRWLPTTPHKYRNSILENIDPAIKEPQNDVINYLRLTPHTSLKIHVPKITFSQFNASPRICLSAYEERLGVKGQSLNILKEMQAELIKRKRPKPEPDKKLDEPDTSTIEIKEEIQKIEVDEEPPKNIPPDPPPDKNEADVVKIEENTNEEIKEKEKNEFEQQMKKEQEEKLKKEMEDKAKKEKEEQIEVIRKGWTVSNAQAITIGDLYLMMGNKNKLRLEYGWENPDSDTGLSRMLGRLVRLARVITGHDEHASSSSDSASAQIQSINLREQSATVSTPTTLISPVTSSPFQLPATPPPNINNRKRPTSHTTVCRLDPDVFRQQINKLTPSGYCNRRSRGGFSSKNLQVVQRTLPLLPKGDHMTSFLTLKLSSTARGIESSSHTSDINRINNKIQPSNSVLVSCPTAEVQAVDEEVDVAVNADTDGLMERQLIAPSPTPSLTTLLLDDLANVAENHCTEPSISGSREDWLNEQVTDYSFSSILSHLDGAIGAKPPSTSGVFASNPPDIETPLHFTITETSIDFITKFADLSAKAMDENKDSGDNTSILSLTSTES